MTDQKDCGEVFGHGKYFGVGGEKDIAIDKFMGKLILISF